MHRQRQRLRHKYASTTTDTDTETDIGTNTVNNDHDVITLFYGCQTKNQKIKCKKLLEQNHVYNEYKKDP